MIIQQERVINVIEELVPLLVEHWEEAEKDIMISLPNPDINTYLELDEAGIYVLVTARFEGKIVGYIGDIVHKSLHYNEYHSLNDVMYVNKDYRKTRCFSKMLKFIESIELKMGSVARFMNLKSNSDNKKGYQKVEQVVYKRLGV